MTTLNHLMRVNGKDVNLEDLARPKLPDPDTIGVGQFSEKEVALTAADHKDKGLGTIYVKFVLIREHGEPTGWELKYAYTRNIKGVRASVKAKAERKERQEIEREVRKAKLMAKALKEAQAEENAQATKQVPQTPAK